MSEESARQRALEARMRQGDQAALAKLFELNRQRFLRTIAYRMDSRLQGRVDPLDVLQDAYVDLSRRLSSYSKYANMSAYVWMRLGIFDRLVALHRQHFQTGKWDVRREVSIHEQAAPDDSSAEIAATLADSISTVSGQVAKEEVIQLIQEALNRIGDIDREIILMRIFEGMTNVEAAQSLGISDNGASSRFARALDRLQKEYIAAQQTGRPNSASDEDPNG